MADGAPPIVEINGVSMQFAMQGERTEARADPQRLWHDAKLNRCHAAHVSIDLYRHRVFRRKSFDTDAFTLDDSYSRVGDVSPFMNSCELAQQMGSIEA